MKEMQAHHILCARDPDRMCIGVGPISGLMGVACELMLHLGVDPDQHPLVRAELEQAIGEETLDLGRAVLAQHGLLPDLTAESAGGVR